MTNTSTELIKLFKKDPPLLDQEAVSGLFDSNITGIFRGREAFIEIRKLTGGHGGPGRPFWGIRVKLNHRVNVPASMSDTFPLNGFKDITVENSEWVSKCGYIDSEFPSTREGLENIFINLSEIADKIEKNEIIMEDSIAQFKKGFLKDLLMIPIALVIFIAFVLLIIGLGYLMNKTSH